MSDTTSGKPAKNPPEPGTGTEGTGVCLTGDEQPKTSTPPKPAPADKA